MPEIEPGEGELPDGWRRDGDGFIDPEGNRHTQLPDDPYDPTKRPPKPEGEGKKLSEAPKEERDAIENDNTKEESERTIRESINDDAKSSKSESPWKLMRSLLKLLLAGFLATVFGLLIYGDVQTQDQCKCNYERTKEQCTQSPVASYSPGCKYCDRKEPKSCCRTCKDVLNQNVFFGLINLSFLGTDDIIDLKSSGCKSETEDECCTSWTSRVGTSTDEVSSCLMKGVEKILEWIFYAFIVIFIIFNIPFIFRLITGFIGLFDKSDDKEHGHSTWWLLLPNLIIMGIVGIILYARGDNNTDLSVLAGGATIMILLYFIMNIWNFFHLASSKSSSSVSYNEYGMDSYMGYGQMGGGKSGGIIGMVLIMIVLGILIIIGVNCFSDSSSSTPSSCDNSGDDITKQSNLLWDVYYNSLDSNNCFDDNNTGGITQYGTCFLHPYDTVFGNEGFDNSPPDCNVINSDYSSGEGDKKYYCFTSGCGYDSNNCISQPDCGKVNTEDESTSSAVKNYAEVAGEMLGTMVAFSAGITAAKAGLKKMDELVLKRILSVIAEKLMLETVESVMDPLAGFGFLLDLGDPCHYQSFVSNNDIKQYIRDSTDAGSIHDRSKPNFLPLSYLSIIENSRDSNALPFQIIYRAYVGWSTYVNAGISQVALKGNNIDTSAAKKASDETTDNNYCTFLNNYDNEYGSLHKNLEKIYYSDPDVINQINNDEPDTIKSVANNISELKQIQLWKYIYRYCKNGGITTVEDSSGNKKIVLYNGDSTDGKTNLPNLWDNEIDGMPALSTYIITKETLLTLAEKDLIINGPATLNGVGGKALQNLLKSRNHGVPCQTAGDPTKQCILDDLVISVSNIYRDYSGCRSDGTSQDCDVIYTEFPNKEEFPLYYPSSSLVNTICRYSTRGMKWINQRYSHYTKSEENIDRVFNGANEKVDNISPGVLGPNYYNEETGLCNFTTNYCHQKACRHAYCYPMKDHKDDPGICKTQPGSHSHEVFVDCDNSDWQKPWEWLFGETLTCGAEHLFTDGSISCPT